MRIGSGFDVHQLVEGRKLILGGVEIPWHKGLEGHSDADALIHALCDALLGASGQGDIGHHFPPDDDQYKGVDSRILLRKVAITLKALNWTIGNVDCTVLAEKPKIGNHIPAMIDNLAADLSLSKNQINIKATTTEKLGFIGREEGIAAQAVVLLESLR